MPYRKADRKGSHALIGLYGLSGGGKTRSAIHLARGIVGPKGRIAFIDTESGRGSHFSTVDDYDIDDLSPPFGPRRYIEKIEEAEKAGYPIVIIDSMSHEWEGIGGCGDIADGTSTGGLGKWKDAKLEHRKMMNKLLAMKIHLIFCCRGREKFAQVKDEKGKQVIVSRGIMPIQERDFIFEMTVSAQVVGNEAGRGGYPIVQKCPTELLPAFASNRQLTVQSGEMIRQWLDGAVPVDHEYEALSKVARDISAMGSARLKQHWESLTKDQRLKLADILPDLKSSAAEADRQSEPPDDHEVQDNPLDDSFTPSTKASSAIQQAHEAFAPEGWDGRQ